MTLINLVNVGQLKMRQEMNSVFKDMGQRKEGGSFSEIYMLDTCLCVEVIHFQIGIKFFCIHFYSTWKCTNPISITIGHLVSDVVSRRFPRAGLHFRISKFLSTHVLCSSVILSVVRLVDWMDWHLWLPDQGDILSFFKVDQKRNHFICLLASLDCCKQLFL